MWPHWLNMSIRGQNQHNMSVYDIIEKIKEPKMLDVMRKKES